MKNSNNLMYAVLEIYTKKLWTYSDIELAEKRMVNLMQNSTPNERFTLILMYK